MRSPSSAFSPLRAFKSPLHLLAFLGVAAAFLFATSYPFRVLSFENGVRHEPGRATFAEPGLLLAPGPVPWVEEAIRRGGFVLSIVARSFADDQRGPARVFTVARGIPEQNLTVGQVRSDLVVRLRRHGSTVQGVPPFVVPDVFADRAAHEIVLEVSPGAVRINVDGVRRVEEPQREPPLALWGDGFDAVLGNDSSWIRPWLGEISSARFEAGDVSIDMLAVGVLHAPSSHLDLNELALYSTNPVDALLNFLAFLPLGAMLFASLARPTIARVALLWAPVVLLAESSQLFLANRHPSVPDFALNVSGAIVGAALWAALRRRRKSSG